VLLVRHGQSTWNAESRWQGKADPPLSELGERQAEAAAAAVALLDITSLRSSDLARARQTAELLAPPGIAVRLEPAFQERDAGEWTGLTRDEIEARFPGDLEARRSPPGFEQDEPLLERVLPAIRTVHAELAAGEVALVVTHGGVIRTVERLLDAPAIAVPNLGGRWIHSDARGDLVLGERELLIDPDEVVVTTPEQI
jgi:broad specificity phosphatase PhoE